MKKATLTMTSLSLMTWRHSPIKNATLSNTHQTFVEDLRGLFDPIICQELFKDSTETIFELCRIDAATISIPALIIMALSTQHSNEKGDAHYDTTQLDDLATLSYKKCYTQQHSA
jgi:hypothetical protein